MPSPGGHPRGISALRHRSVLLLAAGLLLLGGIERAGRVLVSRHLLPTRGAAWIWAEGALEQPESTAFYAVRDFELDTPPRQATLHVLADEAYVLYLNGRRVGSGAYFANAPLDTYRLDRTLRPGWNRLAVELRSGRGAGGLLLALIAEGERAPLVASDATWRVFADATGVIEGRRAFGDGRPATVWQVPPHGGWGVPRLAETPRPTFGEVTVPPGRLAAAPVEPEPGPIGSGEGGRAETRDFGRPLAGYLLLRGLADVPRRFQIAVGLAGPGEETLDVVLAAGQSTWSTAETRTLRYVSAPGLPENAPALLEVEPSFAAEDARRRAARALGVFGVEPPPRGR